MNTPFSFFIDMDVQATQSYIEDDAKESGDTSESSELRSLASHMGLKSGTVLWMHRRYFRKLYTYTN